MKTVWLIDANSYQKEIHPKMLQLRKQFFSLKSRAKEEYFGHHIVPTGHSFSLGLLRIATILNRNNINVKYFHLQDVSRMINNGEFENCLTQDHPSFLGFSCVTPTVQTCNDIAVMAKITCGDLKTGLGGSHAIAAPQKTRNQLTAFDYLFCESETDIILLFEKIFGEKLSIPKFADEYVEYSLLPYSLDYYDLNIFTSIGCIQNCKYCLDNRRKPFMGNLDGGLTNLTKQQLLSKNRMIHFFDSSLGYSYARSLAVCDAIVASKHQYQLSCDLRADSITPELVYMLVKAGFVEISIGAESGDDNVLQASQKDAKCSDLINALKIVKENSNLYVSLYSLTGLPGTTSDTIHSSKDFFSYLLGSGLADEMKNAIFVPYPIDSFDYEKMGVYIFNQNWSDYDRQSYPVYNLNTMSAAEIWQDYLAITEYIVSSWAKKLGFSSLENLPTDRYPETFASNYIGKET